MEISRDTKITVFINIFVKRRMDGCTKKGYREREREERGGGNSISNKKDK